MSKIRAEEIRYKWEVSLIMPDQLDYLSSVVGDIILWLEQQEKQEQENKNEQNT